jgi:signal transduction histidine kinase
MNRTMIRWAPIAIGAVVAALVTAGFSLGLHLPNLHNGLIAATFTAVGVFVLARRPGHREGQLILAVGAAHAVMFFCRQYGLSAAGDPHASRPGLVWVTWLGVWPLAMVLALTGITFMCFPDGRLPSPRWLPVVVAMVTVAALLSVASALWPIEYVDDALPVRHPLSIGGYDLAQRLWNIAGAGSYLLFQVVWLIGVAVRLRRARGDEARQLRWFTYALAVGAAAMVIGLLAFGSPTLGVLAVPVVPVAAGVAIVRYRLYDIDLVINKTVVIGAMAALITAGYVAVVVGIGRLVGEPERRPVLSLAATALVAIAFEPVRRRVRAAADLLVYGRRATPYESLARLSTQLSWGAEHTDLFDGLASAIADGVGAGTVAVWVGGEDDLVAVACWPPAEDGSTAQTSTVAPRRLAALADGDRTHVRPIVHQGSVRGAVTLTKVPGETLTAAEDRLFHDLVAQAGLVVELQQRLQQISVQAAELRAAGKRIVAAQDEARRRIERDLHDGAQQRLVTLALSLQAIAGRAESTGDHELAGRITSARSDLSGALAELREMARGIHPAILTQEGFGAALEFLAERAPLPVRVDLRLEQRLPQDVEAAAYFVVSEALTNAAKHAAASTITVAGQVRDGRFWLEVADDGRGGADSHRGSGLQGLVDRLATLNGRLTVRSPVNGGTRLRAEIPCG